VSGALQGVGIVAVLIVLGWVLGRTKVLPADASGTLVSFAYWAATPALLFSVLASQDLHGIFGAPLLVAAVSGFGTALIFVLPMLLLRPSKANLTLGAMSSSLNNIAYIGIPIATFVLGSPHFIVPTLAFQLGLFTPMFFTLADLVGSKKTSGITVVAKTVFTNPLVIAAILAMVWNISGIVVPGFLLELTDFLGSAGPPTVLVAFGASLVGRSVHVGKQVGVLVAWASFGKLAIQPLIAWSLGLALGMPHEELVAITILAALPTAQNAFIAATRAGAGQDVAQGTVLVTSALSLPVILLLAALLI